MNRIFLLLMIMGFYTLLSAQEQYYPGTIISADVLEKLKSTFDESQENIAAVNAVSNNEIKKLALSRENAGKVNHYFSHTVETKGITNQNKSGRCWLYTGLNTLRPVVREKYELGEFEFSQTYNFFYDQLEKANLYEGVNWKFINLSSDQVKEFAKNSIIGNDAMYFSCDVGKQLDMKTGTLDINNYDYNALMGVEFDLDKKQRIETYESGSTHGMALVGVNILADGNVDKWLLENSWGADKGNKGYLTMTDQWFDEYMFRLVVNKKYLDSKTLEILEQEATLLPPWDPVFAMEE